VPEEPQEDYLQYVADGAETIRELIASLTTCAKYYEDKLEEGWELGYPVDAGRVYLEQKWD
jgi:hypothetical protein